MMARLVQVSLSDMICELGEDRTKSILANFSCPKNNDVSDFLKSKSIEFSKQGLSKTHLVFYEDEESKILAGYFTLAMKTISIPKKSLSNKLQKRITKFCRYNVDIKRYMLPSILIAQLGKNYSNNANKKITGDTLLKMAHTEIKKVQKSVGGKVVYLECEDNDYLKSFYKKNGFVEFGKRTLDKDEADALPGKYLVQMLKYFNS